MHAKGFSAKVNFEATTIGVSIYTHRDSGCQPYCGDKRETSQPQVGPYSLPTRACVTSARVLLNPQTAEVSSGDGVYAQYSIIGGRATGVGHVVTPTI